MVLFFNKRPSQAGDDIAMTAYVHTCAASISMSAVGDAKPSRWVDLPESFEGLRSPEEASEDAGATLLASIDRLKPMSSDCRSRLGSIFSPTRRILSVGN